MDLKRITFILILLIAIVFILIVGKSILIPLVLALLIWFLIKEIRRYAQKIPFIGKRMPKWLLNLFSVGLLYVLLGLMVNVLINNIQELKGQMDVYESNLNQFNSTILEKYGFDIEGYVKNNSGEINFTNYLSQVLSSFSDILGNAFMIGLYLLFILMEESIFGAKILSLSPTKEKRHELEETLTKIGDSISKYISLKTLVSITTGFLSYLALLIIGVDSPFFWAFLIFVLNFIPTIGSLIATLFPASMALLQFGEIQPAIIVLVAVGAIQVAVGNVIEPKVMGNSLNVSSLVVILALSLWGVIWGITGMVLSVPITVILVILFGQFESTKNIAILLSDKGKLYE